MTRQRFRSIVVATVATIATPALAEPPAACTFGTCTMKLTALDMQLAAERLVGEGRYAEAKPLALALGAAPGYALQSRFLTGLIASEMGNYAEAARLFQSVLADDPSQTRARLELGKAMLALHRPGSADRQFAMAMQDRDLPPEVARTIRTVRDTIRAARPWQVEVNVGLAPDTNINNATAANQVTVMLGDTPVPLQLNDAARAKSGLGQLYRSSGRLRLPVGGKFSALADTDVAGTNYAGKRFDDTIVQGAGGIEYGLSETASMSLQAVGAQRWFAGDVASRQVGARAGGQLALDGRNRLGVQLDMRSTKALFDRGYSGWQGGLYLSYERALSSSIVASLSPFVRRDWLNAKSYSKTEVGMNVGVGGELPKGFNVGLGFGASRALFDATLPFFATAPRRDWRGTARLTVGNRKLSMFGLSPQVGWSVSRIDSSIGFFRTSRNRFEFSLARYF